MRNSIWRFLIAALCLLVPLPSRALTASALKCEYQVTPLAVDTLRPRLSWILKSDLRGERSTQCHILVASSTDLLNRNEGDLWDATLRNSESINVEYMGRPLSSGMVCWWKVQPYDKNGAAGPWSQPSHWEMGLLTPSDWQAKWIGDGKSNPANDADFYKPDPAPLFRKEFRIPGVPVRARLAISGLGYYEARLNGRRIGDELLAPAWTNYARRVCYTVYDVTNEVRSGANCLGVTLGNGWYNPLPLRMFGAYNLRDALPVGRPRFIAQLNLTYADGSSAIVASDGTWSVADGPLQFNSVYLGEIYDARKERTGWDRPSASSSGWRPAALCDPPAGQLESQSQPPIRVTRKLPTRLVTEPKPGVFLFDMGQNFAGLVRLTLSAPAGTKVVLRYGELLYKDGTLNPMTSVAGQVKGSRRRPDGTLESVGGAGAPPIAWQTDTYITKGKGVETYTPAFTFHGFRYVEVTGLPVSIKPDPQMLVGLRMNSDVERVGFFQCSDSEINRIQQMCDTTFLSNLFSVQSDCPHRERFGYGGDLAATCDTFLMNYDMNRFYAKVVRDFEDAARPDGMLTDTAPYVGIQYCGIAWAFAHPLVQRRLYQYYGDQRLIAEQYPAAQRWLDLVDRQYPDHLITTGLSDHESLAPTVAPVLLTPLYVSTASIVSELAGIAAQSEAGAEGSARLSLLKLAGARDARLAADTLAAYQAKYVSSDGDVGADTQAALAFALEWNVLPESLRRSTAAKLVKQTMTTDGGHVTTGIFGTNYLLDMLSRTGSGEAAYAVVTAKGSPGWSYMLENGATTLWEHWLGSDNTYSQNHPMFGSVSQWFCQWIGGIAPAKDAVGFNKIDIHPLILKALRYSEYRYRSIRGDVMCRWHRTSTNGESYAIDIQIPVGTTAVLDLSESPEFSTGNENIREGGQLLSNAHGVHIRTRTAPSGANLIDLESGSYHFTVTRAGSTK